MKSQLTQGRGKRFSCTPYYPNAPPTPNPVPPVSPHEQPASFEPPDLVQFSSSTKNSEVPIWRSIEYMDHEAMDLLRRPGEEGAVEKWEAYLLKTKVGQIRLLYASHPHVGFRVQDPVAGSVFTGETVEADEDRTRSAVAIPFTSSFRSCPTYRRRTARTTTNSLLSGTSRAQRQRRGTIVV